MEMQLDTGYATQAEQNTITKSLAAVAYQQQNYAKAIDFGNRLIKGGGGDADTYTLVAQSYYLQKNYKETAKFLGDYINDQERKGVAPKEQSLQLLANSYEKAGDTNGSDCGARETGHVLPEAWLLERTCCIP